jgi:diadenosine tetraphosphate (Ap4A) HIT family hydrolase
MTPTTQPDCPFCRSNNLLKGEVLAETDHAFLVLAQFGSRNHLIIPSSHTEELTDLPDSWWQDFKALLAKVPGLTGDYNVSLNYGPEAGQTVKHLHFWIIPRDAGTPASGKGFARLIDEANQATSAGSE